MRGNFVRNCLTALVLSLAFVSCSKDTNVTGNIDVTNDTAKNGMITGKVVIPVISENTLGWTGVEGASVQIVGTDFETTSKTGGLYGIDDVPTGSYDVKATLNFSYNTATQSVVVERQQTSTVPDLQLAPSYESTKQILYGHIYQQDKSTPLANKQLNLCLMAYSNGTEIPGDVQSSIMTGPNGEYAFYVGDNTYMMTTDGGTVSFINGSSSSQVVTQSGGIQQIDAYVSQ